MTKQKETASVKNLKEAEMTRFAPMYIYATEMVGSYYTKIGVQNKRVLTIAGSGDQVLNAYTLGAREVVGFDVNIRSFFMTQLKIVAVQTLTLKEFLVFFGEKKPNTGFSYKIYQKVRSSLERKSRLFFDRVYKKFHNNGLKMVQSEYFRQRHMFTRVTPMEINAYLRNERMYRKLRDIFSSSDTFEFIQADLRDIWRYPKFRSAPFDVINLSNAPNYVFSLNEMPVVVENFLDLLEKFRRIVTKKGVIFFYTYAFENYLTTERELPPLSRREAIARISRTEGFRLSSVRLKGYIHGMDKVVVLKKI